MDIAAVGFPLWTPSGVHERLIGLSAVKSITLAANEHGLYIQVLGQNVRMTFDGTNPAFTPNDIGFQLTPSMGPLSITGFPGMTLKFIQEAASATIQYQKLTRIGP